MGVGEAVVLVMHADAGGAHGQQALRDLAEGMKVVVGVEPTWQCAGVVHEYFKYLLYYLLAYVIRVMSTSIDKIIIVKMS